MKDAFFERLTLFEGVLIGVYGNWLISFFDKYASQESTPLLVNVLLVFVFATFLLFFALCWLSSKSKTVAMFSGVLHVIFVLLVVLSEWHTAPNNIWFTIIGQGIFWILVAFVVTKSEYEELFVKGMRES